MQKYFGIKLNLTTFLGIKIIIKTLIILLRIDNKENRPPKLMTNQLFPLLEHKGKCHTHPHIITELSYSLHY